MCQACQKPNEFNSDPSAQKTIEELNEVIQCLNERAAENDRIINQLIIGACILGVTVGIFAIIWYKLLHP